MVALCAACCLGILNDLKAQELVTNAGGQAETANASLGWSIGQIVTETYSVSGFTLTQGFHQSTIMVTAIDSPIGGDHQFIVYPNPTQSFLLITSDDPHVNMSDDTILVYDMQGHLVLRREGIPDIMTIDMKDYSPSVYLLKVVSSDNPSPQTFHIIKH